MLQRATHVTAATRLAVLGCAYGNVPALAACLDDAIAAGAGIAVFAGDALGFCGHAAEIVALVRTRCAVVVAGNHDQEGAAGSTLCGCGHADATDEALSCAASARQGEGLDDEDRSWLAALPPSALVTTPAGAVLICHGSPERTNEFLYGARFDAVRVGRWLDASGAVGLVCSHTGLPWRRVLPDRRWAVNCGSAGKPDHDGDAAVHYALIDVASATIAIRRVVYDHRAWVARLIGEGFDERFLAPLLTGRWAWGSRGIPAGELAQEARA